MLGKYIGTAAGACALGLALSATPSAAAPLTPSAAQVGVAADAATTLVQWNTGARGNFAIRGGGQFHLRGGPRFAPRQVAPRQFAPRQFAPRAGFQRQFTPSARFGQVAPRASVQRFGQFRPWPGHRVGRVAFVRPAWWWHPGRRLWVYPAIGAAAIAITLAPGWYWGDYYDECLRWVYPCPGCAPALIDLCEPY